MWYSITSVLTAFFLSSKPLLRHYVIISVNHDHHFQSIYIWIFYGLGNNELLSLETPSGVGLHLCCFLHEFLGLPTSFVLLFSCLFLCWQTLPLLFSSHVQASVCFSCGGHHSSAVCAFIVWYSHHTLANTQAFCCHTFSKCPLVSQLYRLYAFIINFCSVA